ncbi:hypothetical protein ACHAXN_004689 [Cyclotella atomus]
MIRNYVTHCGSLASRQPKRRLTGIRTDLPMSIADHKRHAPNNESKYHPTHHHTRYSSSKSNDNLNGSTQDILDSTAATTQWKRNHYRKITEKFDTNTKDDTPNSNPKEEPLQIDNYEDVQPMWKQMESRVTRRRSLTEDQRGGVSGRRNVRRSDEDVWLEAGVYDVDDRDGEKEKKK